MSNKKSKSNLRKQKPEWLFVCHSWSLLQGSVRSVPTFPFVLLLLSLIYRVDDTFTHFPGIRVWSSYCEVSHVFILKRPSSIVSTRRGLRVYTWQSWIAHRFSHCVVFMLLRFCCGMCVYLWMLGIFSSLSICMLETHKGAFVIVSRILLWTTCIFWMCVVAAHLQIVTAYVIAGLIMVVYINSLCPVFSRGYSRIMTIILAFF